MQLSDLDNQLGNPMCFGSVKWTICYSLYIWSVLDNSSVLMKCLLRLCARRLCNVICYIWMIFSAIDFQTTAREEAKSHWNWLHCFTFPHCAFSNVSSNCLSEKRHSHIGCICLTFLQCAFSNVSSNCLPQRMHSHIGCICSSFLHCGFSNVSSNF